MRPNAIFRSVSQALHVSFVIDSLPVTQKCSTQVLIERLMEDAGVARSAKQEGSVNFSGLEPMLVRAQCAMVRAAVEHHCEPYERAAIVAWFSAADRDGKTVAEHERWKRRLYALKAVHGYAQRLMTVEPLAAQEQIVMHVHEFGPDRHSRTERSIAEAFGLSQPTVHRNVVIVRKAVGQLRRDGMDRLEALFARDGLVERIDSTRVSA